MSITAPPQQSHSRDAALAAITQALGQIGHADEQPARLDEMALKSKQQNAALRPFDQSRITEPDRRSSRGKIMLRNPTGVLALACIGVVAFAWLSTRDQAAPEPISTGSVSTEKRELPPGAQSGVTAKTDAVNAEAGLPQASSRARTLPYAVAEAPTAAPMASDPAQSIQLTARELANVEQGIEQLKASQAQMVRDNAELAAHLKATQEMVRHSADLAEDLKAVQAQMARNNLNFAEQLKTAQEQTANIAGQLKASREEMAGIAEQIKGNQEQLARIVASGQKPRPRVLASSPPPATPPIASSARKPVPTPPSPQVRVQTADPRRLQPVQQ
jgi:hypothetical protein